MSEATTARNGWPTRGTGATSSRTGRHCCTSFPAFFPNVVAKFLNASTIDGYNPYRVTQDGIDWEVPDADDPWSHIGYWGDHQIVYLLRLLEAWQHVEPDALNRWLNRPIFVYADVPYRIADHEEIVADPRNTITYEQDRAREIAARERRIGADGRLVVGIDGTVVTVDLLEKLLVPALAKLSNFVPDGGIWLNTQRPEWNDANNALGGTRAVDGHPVPPPALSAIRRHTPRQHRDHDRAGHDLGRNVARRHPRHRSSSRRIRNDAR